MTHGSTSSKMTAREVPTGKIPITHEQIKSRIYKIPMMQKVSPIVRRYLVEQPHAYLERFEAGDEIPMEDADFKLDFFYVLKGSIQIDMELGQV